MRFSSFYLLFCLLIPIALLVGIPFVPESIQKVYALIVGLLYMPASAYYAIKRYKSAQAEKPSTYYHLLPDSKIQQHHEGTAFKERFYHVLFLTWHVAATLAVVLITLLYTIAS
jgi:Ca2+/Na+ antiporter